MAIFAGLIVILLTPVVDRSSQRFVLHVASVLLTVVDSSIAPRYTVLPSIPH